MLPGIPSLKGQLLLDGGKLRGSYFNRTVVLICEHTSEGALGLVLNRPSEAKLGEIIDRQLPESISGCTLFGGGPVQPSALTFLHSDEYLPASNVLDNLVMSHDLDELIDLGQSWSPTKQLRVFAGYAGWSPGQLDNEMRRESWLTHPASVDLVFRTPPESLWRHVISLRPNWQERLLADAPEDLSAN
ncbi:MAG TPA: YqgE/AlgH family protein [Candidatus Limnocylindria bacterium]|nr:YqgE/AlgH family protein [Candidatus Limnocylindria bacterium]